MNTILNELTNELNNLKWSKSNNKKYGRQSLNVSRTDDEEEPDRFYFICGLIRDWSRREYNNYEASLRISKASKLKKHQRIIELATKYIELLDPNFTYTSIQFSKCMLTPKHVDKNNVGNSIIVGVGDYTGGALNIHHGEEVEPIDIWRTPYMFDAGNTYHSTGEFSGDRITITWFSVKDFK